MRSNEPALRRILVARLGRDRGSIATGEALSWAWEHWEKVRNLDRPIPYLTKVGVSRTRWRRRSIDHQPAPPTFIPEYEPRLEAVLSELPDRQRGCVVLIAGLGYSFSETAELLGIGKSTVQRHYERGIAKLRDGLGATEEEQ